MSHDNPDYLHLTAHKFSITCKTCGITETFYSELSVGYFRLKHEGHELVEAAPPKPRPTELEPREEAPSIPPPAPQEPLAPANETDSPNEESGPAVKVERVIVDTRVSPRDGFPVIRVRGMKADELLFVRLFKPEEAGKMRQFLGSGRYDDQEGGNEVFTWDEGVISFQDEPEERRAPVEAKKIEVETRGFVPPEDSVLSSIESLTAEESSAPTPSAPMPEPPPAPEPSLPRTQKTRRTEKPRVVEQPIEKVGRPKVEPQVAAAAPLMVEEPTEKAPPAKPEPSAAIEKQPTVEIPTEKVAPPKVESPVAVEKPEKAKKNQEALLLAKSSYVQEGEESMKEAVRISKILRAFRWNVEPVYMIGVILEDNLSIETNKGEISGSLVKQIENAGYKLSAVTANSSKPTAWFKRKPTAEVPLVDDPERTRELEKKVAELSKTLKAERSGATELKAAWEKRFLHLTRLVSSLRESAPDASAEPDDSEASSETDVTS